MNNKDTKLISEAYKKLNETGVNWDRVVGYGKNIDPLRNNSKLPSNELPHDFDLHFDLKTKEQLFETYKQLKQRVTDIEHLCKTYNIKLPKNIE